MPSCAEYSPPGHCRRVPPHSVGRKRLDTDNGDRRMMDMRPAVELIRGRRTGFVGTKSDCPGADTMGELAGTIAAAVIEMSPRARIADGDQVLAIAARHRDVSDDEDMAGIACRSIGEFPGHDIAR